MGRAFQKSHQRSAHDWSWELCRCRGSVAPAALKWAVPCCLLTVLYHKALREWSGYLDGFENPVTSETSMWALFTTILGFLVVFRAQLSYARYWEGITLVEQACAVWLNGVSNLFAFCSADPSKEGQVHDFQYLTARLSSLLVCQSMVEISRRDETNFPHVDLTGIDPSCLEYLETTSAKPQIVLQWLQRLVVEQARIKVIDIEPPILSRVFQEFSIGIVHFIDARKLTAVPFPFQFAQMVVLMLTFFSLGPVPLICAVGVPSVGKAATYSFLIIFIFWSVHYIAVEIEHPFGEDPNDLPLEVMNERFNTILLKLLDPKAQNVPHLMRHTDEDEALPTRSQRPSKSSSCKSPPTTPKRAKGLGGIPELLSSKVFGKSNGPGENHVAKKMMMFSGSDEDSNASEVSPPSPWRRGLPCTSPASSAGWPSSSGGLGGGVAAAAAARRGPTWTSPSIPQSDAGWPSSSEGVGGSPDGSGDGSRGHGDEGARQDGIAVGFVDGSDICSIAVEDPLVGAFGRAQQVVPAAAPVGAPSRRVRSAAGGGGVCSWPSRTTSPSDRAPLGGLFAPAPRGR